MTQAFLGIPTPCPFVFLGFLDFPAFDPVTVVAIITCLSRPSGHDS